MNPRSPQLINDDDILINYVIVARPHCIKQKVIFWTIITCICCSSIFLIALMIYYLYNT